MPKRKMLRKIAAPPDFKGFKPYGISSFSNEEVELFYEEYEAIKLSDYEKLKHEDASKKMEVSRATFARIYDSARKKIAKALVEKKEIKAVYGNAYLENDWYICDDCNNRFSVSYYSSKNNCTACSSNSIKTIQ